MVEFWTNAIDNLRGTEEDVSIMADKHWEWINGVLLITKCDEFNWLDLCKYLYKTAFVHGYKHGKQY